MTDPTLVPFPASENSGDKSADGRRLRGERSRRQIIDALFELIRSGEFSPTAAQVAAAAGVSLRTVFRHFDDADGLNREMAAEVEAEVLPIIMRPFEATDWRRRLFELVARRAAIYERVLPLKVAASLRRFRSEVLMDDYRRFLTLEEAGLKAVIPEIASKAPDLFSAIQMATSFQAWRRLRHDQDLSPADAEAVMRLTVEKLVAG